MRRTINWPEPLSQLKPIRIDPDRIAAFDADPRSFFELLPPPGRVVRYRLAYLPYQPYSWRVHLELHTGEEMIGYGGSPRGAEIVALHLSGANDIYHLMRPIDDAALIRAQEQRFDRLRYTITEFTDGLLENRNGLDYS